MPHFRSPTWSRFCAGSASSSESVWPRPPAPPSASPRTGPGRTTTPPPPASGPRPPSSTAASPGSTPPGRSDAQGPQGQDRPARLLDALLHQLHPHPARPGQAGEEVRQRARRHRRPLGQVREREGHREHPQGHPPLRDRPPGRQRRRPRRSGTRYGVSSWPTLVLIDPEGNYRRPDVRRGATTSCSTRSSAS